MRVVPLTFALLLAAVVPGGAQSSPEDLARRYSEALAQGDFAGAARLTHPAAQRQMRELFEPLLESALFDQLGPTLFSVSSRDELVRTADSTLFAAFLRNAVAREDGLGDALRSAKTTVLGTVPGAADTAYVVMRVEMTVEGIVISQFDVMPALRHDGVWLGLLKADFGNMAILMRRALEP